MKSSDISRSLTLPMRPEFGLSENTWNNGGKTLTMVLQLHILKRGFFSCLSTPSHFHGGNEPGLDYAGIIGRSRDV